MSKDANDTATIWVVDDDESLRWVLDKTFTSEGLSVRTFEDAYEALEAFEEGVAPEVMLSDIRMPGMDGLTFLTKVHEIHPELPVIIMTAHSDLDSAVSSYKTGAFEYLPKPFDIDEALSLVARARQALADKQKHVDDAQAKQPARKDKTKKQEGRTHIIGESPAMQEVFRAIGRLAHANITVLINGESGTGKELVAAALHEHSPRKDKAFIALNMAAIPSELIEAELFGHEKGAFTGATSLRKGRFEQADGGTLFLDEIGDMPFATQTRLLRVLADGEFFRVGGHTPVKVDVRIIAATHQNLESLVEAGKFREDLFYRLNVIRLHIPALRERTGDIPMLAKHFLARSARELEVEPKTLTDASLEQMQAFNWRGNVRQLENTCRWLMVMASGREIGVEDLPQDIQQYVLNKKVSAADTAAQQPLVSPQPQATTEPNTAPAAQAAQDGGAAQLSNPTDATSASQHADASDTARISNTGKTSNWQAAFASWVHEALASGQEGILQNAQPEFERVLIIQALEHTKGRKGDAANVLGWGRNTLTRKMQELGLD